MLKVQSQGAPWLDKIVEDHDELKNDLAEFRGFLGSPRPDMGNRGYHTWAAACAVRLVGLHDNLFRHFRFEEQGGMLRDLADMHPRALPQVEAIEREHPQMLEQIREITADVLVYSEGKPPKDSRIRRRITAVLNQLLGHERAEMDLIQRVLCRDIGDVD